VSCVGADAAGAVRFFPVLQRAHRHFCRALAARARHHAGGAYTHTRALRRMALLTTAHHALRAQVGKYNWWPRKLPPGTKDEVSRPARANGVDHSGDGVSSRWMTMARARRRFRSRAQTMAPSREAQPDGVSLWAIIAVPRLTRVCSTTTAAAAGVADRDPTCNCENVRIRNARHNGLMHSQARAVHEAEMRCVTSKTLPPHRGTRGHISDHL
jgi:hypothetical protein